MAVLTIRHDGDPILRQRSAEVPAAELGAPEFQQLLRDMVETMYAASGIGIAAPQVGVGKRVCIAESADGPIALVNPVILKHSWKKLSDEEGCLSVPGTYGPVDRSKGVTVAALGLDGKELRFQATDLFARIIQHEIDHLDGILFVDRVAAGKAHGRAGSKHI
jgi:peptide deformylase